MSAARRSARIAGPVLGLVLSLAAGPALAEQAEELHQEGIFRYSTGKYQRSLEVLHRALQLTRKPALIGRIQLYIGLNHHVLGQPAEATRAFRAALTADPTLTLDPERHKPGIVAAFEELRRSMKIAPPATGPAPASAPVKQPEATPTPAPAPAPRPAPAPAAPPRPTPGPPRIWTWVAAGTAAAALGVGVGFGIAAESDYAEFQQTNDPVRLEELRDSVSTKSTVANVMFLTAGVVAAGAVALFFLEPRWTRGPAPADQRTRRGGAPRITRVVPLLDGHGAGLSLTAGF
jgi:hypothetical protein